MVTHNTLLAYTDFNGKIDIHAYTINLQLGAVINQEGKPVILFIQNNTNSKTWYTVMEK